MLKKLQRKSNRVLSYIGSDYHKCIYIFLDYIKYGLNDNDISFWIQNDKNGICALILKYHNGMHIYSKKKDIIYHEIVNLINSVKPSVVCSEKYIINELHSYLNSYKKELGFIRELKEINNLDYDNSMVTSATENDIKEITNLIINDEMGSGYTYDDLYEQLICRKKDSYGRNYIIKMNNEIISHAGTGAENEKIALLNYVITKNEFRGKGLAKKVISKICEDLIKEGKIVYLINYSKESTMLYDKLGFKPIVEIGKLSIK